MQPARRTGSSKATTLERLWKDFFADRSQWIDLRRHKRNTNAPDFRHKTTKSLLWVDNRQTPTWVSAMLQKADDDTGCNQAPLKPTGVEAILFLENAAPNQVSTERLIQIMLKCTEDKNQPNALRVLTHLRKHGMDTQRDLGNYLVPMLVAVGSLEDAEGVFDRLTSQNQHSWSSLINGYIKCGRPRHAFNLFDRMQEVSLQPTKVAYVSLLMGCASLKDADRGRDFHAHIDKLELAATDPYIGSSLIDMYVKCGLLEEAQQVFDKCKARNVVLWNALIAGYACHEQGNKALLCFEQMQKEGISPTPITLTCALKACSCAGALEMGQELCNHIENTGLIEKDSFLGNAVIDMYAKFGCFAKARQVLDKLQGPDVVSWTTLISGYVKQEHAEEALDCFEQMLRHGVSPNGLTYACILKACASIEALGKGQEVHTETVMKGFLDKDLVLISALVDMYAKCGLLVEAQQEFDKLQVRDVVSWNALICGYVKKEDSKEAFNCFEQMNRDGCSADSVTYACVLKACAIEGAIGKGQKIHFELESKHLLVEQLVCNALIDMYVKCGVPSEAQNVFDKLPVQNLVAWTLLIAGYAQKGEIENVFLTFDRMEKDRHKPDLVTFLIVLNACSQAGLVERAERYFDSMAREYDIVPSLEHYTCMVDLLGRSGRLESAMAMIKEMPFPPNQVIWHSMLAACRKWNNVEFGMLAFEHAVRLDPKDAVAYVCMGNICVDAGLLEYAEMVDRMRVENQV